MSEFGNAVFHRLANAKVVIINQGDGSCLHWPVLAFVPAGLVSLIP